MAYQRAMGTEPARLAPGAVWLLRNMPRFEEAAARRESERRTRVVTGVVVTLALLAGAGGLGYVGYTQWKKRQE
jgi:hypothetical protein